MAIRAQQFHLLAVGDWLLTGCPYCNGYGGGRTPQPVMVVSPGKGWLARRNRAIRIAGAYGDSQVSMLCGTKKHYFSGYARGYLRSFTLLLECKVGAELLAKMQPEMAAYRAQLAEALRPIVPVHSVAGTRRAPRRRPRARFEPVNEQARRLEARRQATLRAARLQATDVEPDDDH